MHRGTTIAGIYLSIKRSVVDAELELWQSRTSDWLTLKVKSDLGKSAFSFNAPKPWNDLPTHTKDQ